MLRTVNNSPERIIDDHIYSFEEVMEVLDVSQPTLHKWIKTGGLNMPVAGGFKKGRRYVTGADLKRFIAGR